MRLCFSALVILLFLAGCATAEAPTGGEVADQNQQAMDESGMSIAFTEALLNGRYDEAKAMATADMAEEVSLEIDAFTEIADKYEYREVAVMSTRAWSDGSGAEESDKRVEVSFQFRDRTPEDARWRIGSLNLRTMLLDGTWRVADLIPVRPTS